MFKEYSEGAARIKYEKAFLNSAAKLNRDIGIAIIGSEGSPIKMLDATAATGLRGMRYMLESRVSACTFLEINPSVFKELQANLDNGRIAAEAFNVGIQEFCNSTKEKYELVELDPFGGIYPYIFDIAKVLKGGSYLFATATDTAVLCGAHRDACIKLYSAKPMHDELCHEVGLRIMIGYIARTLAQFNFGIDVLLGIFHDHYMRVNIKVLAGARNATESVRSLGFALHCPSCGHIESIMGIAIAARKCPECSADMSVAGPLWIGKLKDDLAIRKILAYAKKYGDSKLLSFSEKLS
ncbi:MAG: hypothetical protein QXN59_01570, partial [Candidatus Micrarchaeaceae archaeon]